MNTDAIGIGFIGAAVAVLILLVSGNFPGQGDKHNDNHERNQQQCVDLGGVRRFDKHWNYIGCDIP